MYKYKTYKHDPGRLKSENELIEGFSDIVKIKEWCLKYTNEDDYKDCLERHWEKND